MLDIKYKRRYIDAQKTIIKKHYYVGCCGISLIIRKNGVQCPHCFKIYDNFLFKELKRRMLDIKTTMFYKDKLLFERLVSSKNRKYGKYVGK